MKLIAFEMILFFSYMTLIQSYDSLHTTLLDSKYIWKGSSQIPTCLITKENEQFYCNLNTVLIWAHDTRRWVWPTLDKAQTMIDLFEA